MYRSLGIGKMFMRNLPTNLYQSETHAEDSVWKLFRDKCECFCIPNGHKNNSKIS